ncbi:hypothetical protein B0H16DRAFT_1886654 [Mycena metata]|uniref:Squalene epoxidase domain-containing protein n=1 Tax=Mycena metata TaxID=1033252 RepID=A0AAD7NCZ3_9AGAR|nr:hypothetical protein B0H16DRAFT_1886654 [Mycena metata]
MRHPLTGGGMTAGLNDVLLLRSLLENLPDLKDHAQTNSRPAGGMPQIECLTGPAALLANTPRPKCQPPDSLVPRAAPCRALLRRTPRAVTAERERPPPTLLASKLR